MLGMVEGITGGGRVRAKKVRPAFQEDGIWTGLEGQVGSGHMENRVWEEERKAFDTKSQ